MTRCFFVFTLLLTGHLAIAGGDTTITMPAGFPETTLKIQDTNNENSGGYILMFIQGKSPADFYHATLTGESKYAVHDSVYKKLDSFFRKDKGFSKSIISYLDDDNSVVFKPIDHGGADKGTAYGYLFLNFKWILPALILAVLLVVTFVARKKIFYNIRSLMLRKGKKHKQNGNSNNGGDKEENTLSKRLAQIFNLPQTIKEEKLIQHIFDITDNNNSRIRELENQLISCKESRDEWQYNHTQLSETYRQLTEKYSRLENENNSLKIQAKQFDVIRSEQTQYYSGLNRLYIERFLIHYNGTNAITDKLDENSARVLLETLMPLAFHFISYLRVQNGSAYDEDEKNYRSVLTGTNPASSTLSDVSEIHKFPHLVLHLAQLLANNGAYELKDVSIKGCSIKLS